MNSGLRKLIFLGLLIGLVYGAYAYMIKPANASLTQRRELVQEKTAKLAKLQKATATAQDLTKQLKRLEEAISFLESRLPPKSQIHTVLEDVTVIAKNHGLTPKTIRSLPLKNNNGYIEQPLKMELYGNFNSYYAFLLELEKLDRITKIRELHLKKVLSKEGYTEATFIVSIFFQNSTT